MTSLSRCRYDFCIDLCFRCGFPLMLVCFHTFPSQISLAQVPLFEVQTAVELRPKPGGAGWSKIGLCEAVPSAIGGSDTPPDT